MKKSFLAHFSAVYLYIEGDSRLREFYDAESLENVSYKDRFTAYGLNIRNRLRDEMSLPSKFKQLKRFLSQQSIICSLFYEPRS